jgi:hypothetical protein
MSTPLAAIGKGLAAGAVGTAAMTAYQGAVAKARDSESSTTPGGGGQARRPRRLPEPKMATDRKLAVVTGASSGIGLELAKQFAENGLA